MSVWWSKPAVGSGWSGIAALSWTRTSTRKCALLHDTLTVDGAVQVALLNNRTLQALYAELGVAQADLVQAGLLRNPVFDGAVRFLLSGGPAKVDLSAALDFLDIFYLPLRKRVAAARFEEAKPQVTGAVLDLRRRSRGRFIATRPTSSGSNCCRR